MSQFLDEYAQGNDIQSASVADRLEAGEAPSAVASALGLSPAGLVAAIARVGLGGEDAEGLPLIRARSVRPQLAAVLAREATLAELFPQASPPDRLALGAGLLQVLDAWDASHHAAQEADDQGETATSAAWHMIAHRREPDPSNARYWARRVKPGTIFSTQATLGTPLLNELAEANPGLVGRLDWNPLTLIDLVGKIQPGSPETTLVRRLQRLEMLVLLDQSTVFDGASVR